MGRLVIEVLGESELQVQRRPVGLRARVGDVAKSTFYVVDWEPSMMEELARGGAAARAKVPFPDAAITLIGVKSLFTPELLIEIEAVAVVES